MSKKSSLFSEGSFMKSHGHHLIVVLLLAITVMVIILLVRNGKKDGYNKGKAHPKAITFKNGGVSLTMNPDGSIPNISANKKALEQLNKLKPMSTQSLIAQAKGQRSRGKIGIASYLDKVVARRKARKEGYESAESAFTSAEDAGDANKQSIWDLNKTLYGEQAECEQSCWIFLLMEKCNAKASVLLGEDPNCSWPCPFSDWHVIGACFGIDSLSWDQKVSSALDSLKTGASWLEANVGLTAEDSPYRTHSTGSGSSHRVPSLKPPQKIPMGSGQAVIGTSPSLFGAQQEPSSGQGPSGQGPLKIPVKQPDGSLFRTEEICTGELGNIWIHNWYQDYNDGTSKLVKMIGPMPDDKKCCLEECDGDSQRWKSCGGPGKDKVNWGKMGICGPPPVCPGTATCIATGKDKHHISVTCKKPDGTSFEPTKKVTLPNGYCKPSDSQWTAPRQAKCVGGKLMLDGNLTQIECK